MELGKLIIPAITVYAPAAHHHDPRTRLLRCRNSPRCSTPQRISSLVGCAYIEYMPADDLMHPQHCLAANLRRTVRAANQFFHERMRATDGVPTQFTLLAAISGFGRCTQGELAAWLGMDPTTVTRSVGLLAGERLVAVTPGKVDRRTRTLALTAEGRRRLEDSREAWRTAQADAIARLGPAKARQLLALLDDVTASLSPAVDEQ